MDAVAAVGIRDRDSRAHALRVGAASPACRGVESVVALESAARWALSARQGVGRWPCRVS